MGFCLAISAVEGGHRGLRAAKCFTITPTIQSVQDLIKIHPRQGEISKRSCAHPSSMQQNIDGYWGRIPSLPLQLSHAHHRTTHKVIRAGLGNRLPIAPQHQTRSSQQLDLSIDIELLLWPSRTHRTQDPPTVSPPPTRPSYKSAKVLEPGRGDPAITVTPHCPPKRTTRNNISWRHKGTWAWFWREICEGVGDNRTLDLGCYDTATCEKRKNGKRGTHWVQTTWHTAEQTTSSPSRLWDRENMEPDEQFICINISFTIYLQMDRRSPTISTCYTAMDWSRGKGRHPI